MLAEQLDRPEYRTAGAALAAAFDIPDGKYPPMDYESSIKTTKSGLLNSVESSVHGAGILLIVRNNISNLHFLALRACFMPDSLSGAEQLMLMGYVRDRMKRDVPHSFIRSYSMPLWARLEGDYKTLSEWSNDLDISLRTLERRSSEVNKILSQLRHNAMRSAEKILVDYQVVE